MKILFMDFEIPYLIKDSDYKTGGIAVEWYSWIKGFVKNGQKFGLLTFKGANDVIKKDIGLDIVESYDIEKGIQKLRTVTYRFPMLFYAVKKYNPDIIVKEGASRNTGLLAIIAKLLNKPYIFRVANDPDVDERIKLLLSKVDYLFYKLGVKIAKSISCQNGYQYEKLRKKYPKKNIFIIHNPYLIKHAGGLYKKSERTYVAWVANFRYQKNLPALLKIVKKLQSFKFKIAGQPFSSMDDLTKQALKELEECNNVEFVGYVKRSEIAEFFNNALLLLNTAHYEGFSNTFLEAWASGTPVVSTMNVNPDNLISKFNLGKVGDSYAEVPKLIEEINSMSESQYENLSTNCFNYVKKYHDPQKLAEKFILCLKQN
jgi:glycosyltransferase involved in cell wall biosynthesis